MPGKGEYAGEPEILITPSRRLNPGPAAKIDAADADRRARVR
jgi:hypothetical protein